MLLLNFSLEILGNTDRIFCLSHVTCIYIFTCILKHAAVTHCCPDCWCDLLSGAASNQDFYVHSLQAGAKTQCGCHDHWGGCIFHILLVPLTTATLKLVVLGVWKPAITLPFVSSWSNFLLSLSSIQCVSVTSSKPLLPLLDNTHFCRSKSGCMANTTTTHSH